MNKYLLTLYAITLLAPGCIFVRDGDNDRGRFQVKVSIVNGTCDEAGARSVSAFSTDSFGKGRDELFDCPPSASAFTVTTDPLPLDIYTVVVKLLDANTRTRSAPQFYYNISLNYDGEVVVLHAPFGITY